MTYPSSLTQMKNIGPAMDRYLRAAGIATPAELISIGAIDAYLKIRPLNPRTLNRMALYALYGAIHHQHCLWLAPEVKTMLNTMLKEAESPTGKKRK